MRLLLTILIPLFFSVMPFGSFAQVKVNISSCDTTISDPSFYTPGDYEITIHSASGSGICFNVEEYQVNYGDVFIYAGTNTSGALLSHLGTFGVPDLNFGGQITGSDITVKFRSTSPGNPAHFRIRVRCLQQPGNFPVFQPMPGIYAAGNIKAADYDKDGDKDLLIGGKVFRNDSYFDSLQLFERKSDIIPFWGSVTMSAADFDGDGLNDFFITGLSGALGGGVRLCAAIYKNTGDGNFTLVPNTAFIPAVHGACSILDFDKDGRPDICYTGSTDVNASGPRITKLYLNKGNMVFADVALNLPGITGLVDGSMSWDDADADGDLDLLMNGVDGTVIKTKVFIQSNGVFSALNLPLTNTAFGGISWADINMDGRPDIVNTGSNTNDILYAITPEILFNNGNNNFTLVKSNLPALSECNLVFADYDGDHDLDAAINGLTPGWTDTDAGVFKNKGNGQFEKVSAMDGAKGSSRLKWYDFNKDGKLDIIGSNGYFIKNMGTDSFHIASFKTTANRYFGYRGIIEDFNGDSIPDMFFTGDYVEDVDCFASTSPSAIVLTKDWRYYAVPKLTEVADVNPINPYTPPIQLAQELYFQWGDYDSDGKLDIIMTADLETDRGGVLVVYRNNGNNNFSVYFNNLATPLEYPVEMNHAPAMMYAGIFDIDNDGINELLVPPNIVYKINGGKPSLFSYDLNNYTGDSKYLDFADYDKDGFTDVVVTGRTGATVYRNNGSGKLLNIAKPPGGYTFGVLAGPAFRQIQWADFDNDGDQDVINSSAMLENRGGNFIPLNATLQDFVHAGVGDINGDGYKDLVTVPRDRSTTPLEIHYGKQGTGFFDRQLLNGYGFNYTHSFDINETALCVDLDNDGDDDIIYAGASVCKGGAEVLINQRSISNKLIHVVSPNGNESFVAGSIRPVQWYGTKLGNSVKIELSADSGLSWVTIASSAISTANGGQYNWQVAGPQSVKCLLRITDNNSNQLDISNAVFSIIAVPEANAGRDTTVCIGAAVKLGSNGLAGAMYAWSSTKGDFTSSEPVISVTPKTTTSYFLTVTAGGKTLRDTVIVTVLDVSAHLKDSLLKVCIGSGYPIGTTAKAGYTYKWTSSIAGFVYNEPDLVIYPAVNAVYYLKTTGLTGCVAYDTVQVIADSCLSAAVSVYPNPATNQVVVQLPLNQQLPQTFLLLNPFGVTVLQQQLNAAKTVINLAGYSNGLYYYVVRSATGQNMGSGQLVIVH